MYSELPSSEPSLQSILPSITHSIMMQWPPPKEQVNRGVLHGSHTEKYFFCTVIFLVHGNYIVMLCQQIETEKQLDNKFISWFSTSSVIINVLYFSLKPVTDPVNSNPIFNQ